MTFKIELIVTTVFISLSFFGCQQTQEIDSACHKNEGIPRISITIDSLTTSITKTDYFQGQLAQQNSNDCESESIQVNIKGRGNTTWAFPKKSYTIKFNEPIPLLDLPSAEKFVLLANYSDKSLLRNKLAFKISEISTLDWTPTCQSVALYLNQEYAGIYLLTQKITVGENALQDEKTILLEIDHAERLQSDDIYFETAEHLFCIKDKPVDSMASYTEIENSIIEAENALMKDLVLNNYKNYFNLPALADWYIINEIAKCNDAFFNSSVYLHFKLGEKIKMGPIWDYDISFGNINYNGNDSIEGFYIKNTNYYKQLFEDSEFTKLVKTRYTYFYSQKDFLLQNINDWATYLEAEASRNFERWPILGQYIWPNAKILNTHQEEVTYLKTWLAGRMDWLNVAISEL